MSIRLYQQDIVPGSTNQREYVIRAWLVTSNAGICTIPESRQIEYAKSVCQAWQDNEPPPAVGYIYEVKKSYLFIIFHQL